MRSRTLDIAIPIYGLESEQIIKHLDAITDNTQIRYNLIILSDCAGSEAVETIKEWRNDRRIPQCVLLRNGTRAYYSSSINQCVKFCRSEYFAVIHPQMTIMDRDWVSKMTMCFKDSQAFLCGIDPLLPLNTRPPIILGKKDRTIHRGLLVFRRPDPEKPLVNTDLPHEPMPKTQAEVLARGQRVYLCQSVRMAIRKFDDAMKPAYIPGIKHSDSPEVLIAG